MDVSVNECAFCAATSVIGFCENCECRLCHSCFKNHNKGKAFKSHVTFLLSDPCVCNDATFKASKATEPKKLKAEQDIHKQKCKTHIHEKQSLYCEKHDVVICGRCVVSDHKSCLEAVIDLHNVKQNDEKLNKALSKLQEMEGEAKAYILDIKESIKENDDCKSECLKHMNTFHEELIEKLGQLKNEAEKNIRAAYQDNVQMLLKSIQSCKEQLQLVQKRKAQIEYIVKNKHTSHLFVTLTRLERDLKDVIVNNPSNLTNAIKKFKLVQNPMLKEILKKPLLNIEILTEVCDGSDEVLSTTCMEQRFFHPRMKNRYVIRNWRRKVNINPSGKRTIIKWGQALCRTPKQAY